MLDLVIVSPLMIYGGIVTRRTSPLYGTALAAAGTVLLIQNAMRVTEAKGCDCGKKSTGDQDY